MKKGLEELVDRQGEEVRGVFLDFWFYNLEVRGDLGHCHIKFKDDLLFLFGCAGDGSVSIIPSPKSVGDAPGITTIRRRIPGLVGRLKEIDFKGSELCLKIENSKVIIRNADDELEVEFNGRVLRHSGRSRSEFQQWFYPSP